MHSVTSANPSACNNVETFLRLAFTTPLGVLVLLSCAYVAVAAGQQRADSDRRQFDGFSFDLPTDWQPHVPGQIKIKAYILPGQLEAAAKGRIFVDVGHPALPNADALAAAVAKRWGGAVLPGIVDVDGEKALQIQIQPRGESMSPRHAITLSHGGKLYLILAEAVAPTDVSGALEHVRTTWKWSDLERSSTSGTDADENLQTIVSTLDFAATTVSRLGVLFVLFGTIVVLKRWFRKQRAQGRANWISLYTILAALFAIPAIASLSYSVRFIIQQAGLPVASAGRFPYVIGFFAAPSLLLIIALALVVLARRRATKGDRQQVTEPIEDQINRQDHQ